MHWNALKCISEAIFTKSWIRKLLRNNRSVCCRFSIYQVAPVLFCLDASHDRRARRAQCVCMHDSVIFDHNWSCPNVFMSPYEYPSFLRGRTCLRLHPRTWVSVTGSSAFGSRLSQHWWSSWGHYNECQQCLFEWLWMLDSTAPWTNPWAWHKLYATMQIVSLFGITICDGLHTRP